MHSSLLRLGLYIMHTYEFYINVNKKGNWNGISNLRQFFHLLKLSEFEKKRIGIECYFKKN